MSKPIRLALRLLSIALVFFFPIGHILKNYNYKTTEIVTITQGGLNPFWTIVLVIVGLIFAMWLITAMLVKWKETIKKKPFGEQSVLTFGTIMILFLFAGLFGLVSIIELIETNAELLVENLEIYKADFQWMFGYALFGTLINVVLILWK